MILEYCDAGSLDQAMRRTKMEVDQKLLLLADVARGLAHLHKVRAHSLHEYEF